MRWGRTLTDEQVAEAVLLRSEGLTYDQIAERLGTRKTVVAGMLRDRTRRWDGDRKEYHSRPEVKKRRKELYDLKKQDPAWVALYTEKWRAYNAKPETRTRRRSWNLKRMYGVTVEEYDRLREEQRNRCECCGDALSSNPKHVHVDHDHDTKAVRGIICHWCNTTIGLLKDSALRAEKVAAYLRKHAPRLPL